MPPNCGYSLAMVLKQWGQAVTIFVTPPACIVSMLAFAIVS